MKKITASRKKEKKPIPQHDHQIKQNQTPSNNHNIALQKSSLKGKQQSPKMQKTETNAQTAGESRETYESKNEQVFNKNQKNNNLQAWFAMSKLGGRWGGMYRRGEEQNAK